MKALILLIMFAIIPAHAANDKNYCEPKLTVTGSIVYDDDGNIVYTKKDCEENFSALLEWILELEDPEATVSIVGKVPITPNNFGGFYKGWPELK